MLPKDRRLIEHKDATELGVVMVWVVLTECISIKVRKTFCFKLFYVRWFYVLFLIFDSDRLETFVGAFFLTKEFASFFDLYCFGNIIS
jgi:hypothetical protein